MLAGVVQGVARPNAAALVTGGAEQNNYGHSEGMLEGCERSGTAWVAWVSGRAPLGGWGERSGTAGALWRAVDHRWGERSGTAGANAGPDSGAGAAAGAEAAGEWSGTAGASGWVPLALTITLVAKVIFSINIL